VDRDKRKGFRPALDPLESRWLMAAHLRAGLAHGVLTVRGTAAADVIAVHLQGDRGTTIVVEGVRRAFRASQVRRIDVLGGKGNDTISVETHGRPNIAVRIDGGPGNDIINGVPDIPLAVPVAPVLAVPQPAAAPPPPPGLSVSSTVQRIIDLTNLDRLKAGTAPLAVNEQLTQAAVIQSGNMARLDVLSHSLPGTDQPALTDRAAAVGYHFTELGENIAFNYADAEAVVAGWMASAGHRANILNADFTEIGASVAFNAQGQPYYTQVFGKPA
jgi:uncharacterized protein YkwD